MLNIIEKKPFKIVEMPETLDLYNATAVKKELFPLADGCEYLAVNFKNVTVIDSSGLGVLAVLSKRMLAENKVFALFNIPDNIYQIMKITSADKYFKIYENFEEIDL